MNVNIEKNVPIPQDVRAPKWGPVVEKLEIGDSFLLTEEMGTIRNMRSNIFRVAKDKGFKLASRAVDGGTRIWRTE